MGDSELAPPGEKLASGEDKTAEISFSISSQSPTDSSSVEPVSLTSKYVKMKPRTEGATSSTTTTASAPTSPGDTTPPAEETIDSESSTRLGPKASPRPGPSSRPKVGPLSRPPGGRKEVVRNPDTLLVEDVRVSAKVAQMALKRARYVVDVASSGEEAVEKFKAHKKSLKLVLMDIMLPKMNGVEATKIIRNFEKESKMNPTIILGLTGNVSNEDLQRYKEADMNGCIAKGELLYKSVKEALGILKERPEQFVVLADIGSTGPGSHS